MLRTRVSRVNDDGILLTHDASIHATAESRAKWNADFWSLYPERPGDFHSAVLREEVAVSIMFRFRPTVRLNEHYGGQPVLEVARIAEGRHMRLHELPDGLISAVDDYERDRRRLEEQRRNAWLELLQLRLPTPPVGYHWELQSGDARSFRDVLVFHLKTR